MSSVSGAGSMKGYGVRLSVCLSVRVSASLNVFRNSIEKIDLSSFSRL